MSLLWVTAAGEMSIETRDAYPKRFGFTYQARVPESHPLAAEHGTLAGYAHVEERPTGDGDYRTHLHMIEVNPGYQGTGVGRALLEHAIKHSDTGDVSHDGFTPSGAGLWQAVTGDPVKPSKRADQPSTRDWRYA